MDKPLIFFGEADPKAIAQIENCMHDERAVAGALMADNHLGYAMPIGGVVAYEDAISPTGVGFDIGCGNKAVRTTLSIFDLGVSHSSNSEGEMVVEPTVLKSIMREIQKTISFGIGRKNPAPVEHAVMVSDLWTDIHKTFGPSLYPKAREQLGTVGSGNHYVDLLVDTSGHIWVACHFGSRGFGHTIASGFMAAAQGKGFTERVPEGEDPVVLSTKKGLGQFYIEAMKLAGEYAYAGRDYVIDQVLRILGTSDTMTVHNHHNFAWLENDRWIVRKGATPLTSQPAFIGGSMGDISVIVQGIQGMYRTSDAPFSLVKDIGALGSAPHGAGRIMSRTAAAGKMRKMWICSECGWAERSILRSDGSQVPPIHEHKVRKVRMRDKSTAAIDWDTVRQGLTERGIVVLGAGADESPGVYKDLAQVLAAHSNIQVLEALQPLGVIMAGADTFDPD